MKDYKHHVLWLDYFNSGLSRDQGRRVSIDKAVRDPTLAELSESVKRLGYEAETVGARHPKRMYLASGYVTVAKRAGQKKQSVISQVAKALSSVRGEKPIVATPAPQISKDHRKGTQGKKR